MADAHRLGGPAPKIAIGMAVVAVVMAAIGMVVAITRDGPLPAPEVATTPPALGPEPHRVEALDVVRLDRDAVEATTAASGEPGIKVTDGELRAVLGLEADDIITAISGRQVKRQFDVYDAIHGASTMNASTLYVEVVRGGTPRLLRWELAGDLRAARSRPRSRSSRYGSQPVGLVKDPLLDTIKKLDELHYEVPRATLEQLAADPELVTKTTRAFPATRFGKAEGFRVYPRPGSFGAAFGLKTSDQIRSVNGEELSGPDKILEVYARLKHAPELRIELQRRGQPEVLKITITP